MTINTLLRVAVWLLRKEDKEVSTLRLRNGQEAHGLSFNPAN